MFYIVALINIVISSIVLWSFFVPAPLTWILVWVISLNIYAYVRMSPSEKMAVIFKDVKSTAFFVLKSCLCIMVFFVIRGYLSHLIEISPYNVISQVENESSFKTINYPAGKIIYEVIFFLGAGWLIIEAVFNKSKKCIYAIVTFLAIAFTAQTILYASNAGSPLAKALISVTSEQKVAENIQNKGIVGGAFSSALDVMFGATKSVNIKRKNTTTPNTKESQIVDLCLGENIFKLSSGEITKWLKPTGCYIFYRSLEGKKFQVEYANGQILNERDANDPDLYMPYNRRIISYCTQTIIITVKE